jgi:hypothetical protein
MRRLGIPYSLRRKISPHEIRRRRVTRLHRQYTVPLSKVKGRIEGAVAFAFRRLEESRAIALPATPADHQWQAADPLHPDQAPVVPTPPAQPEKEAS